MPLSTRKLLHQPLFPLYTSPHSSSSTNPPPFFPFHPPPSLATFPANLSSLLRPSQNTPHHPHPSKLLLILTLPILSLLLLLLLLLLHHYRSSTHNKNIQRNKGTISTGPEKGIESGRLVPPDSELSDSRRATSVPALEGSPELRPLTRHSLRRSYSSDELFYSAGGSQHHEVGSPSSTCSSSMPSVKPPPPPPPPVAQKVRKLKGLHWDKVRASSERSMVWDHLKLGSSFQMDEEKMETLFGCESVRRSGMDAGVVNGVVVVIDPKKSQNIAFALRALNVTTEDVCDALLTGNTDSLGAELLETLLKMAPSKEEELKLKEYKDDSANKSGPAEKFLKAVLDVPFAFKRVDAMLYIASFDSNISYLKKSFTTLELACKELRDNRLFRKLLDAVLKTGNRMNVGTNRGDAHAFKLDTLLKLVDIKGTDIKTTLLHFVVQEISSAEGLLRSTNTLKVDAPECTKIGLRVISKLGTELNNVKKAATIETEILGSYITKLNAGIGKVREVVRLSERRFRESMTEFLKRAEGEIAELLIQEGDVFSLVDDVTEYFHGDSAKEEAHPLRIFMVVRDFLTVLDQVCKEVGRVNERNNVISSEYFLGGWN